MKLFLSIVIPAYNEEDNFKKGCLDKIVKYLKKYTYPYEVIVVDDGSTDKTRVLIKTYIKNKKNWQLTENSHQGKAAAITKGVELAQGQYVLFTDFDQATPLVELEKLLPFINKGYDVVVGSREVKGAKRLKEPFYRHLMGKAFNMAVKLIVFSDIQDTQCGFKLFKTKVAKDLFKGLKISHLETKRAFTGAFDVELLFLSKKRGYKVTEVPVVWQHFMTTRVNPVKDSVRMFFDVLKIRLYDLMGRYEI